MSDKARQTRSANAPLICVTGIGAVTSLGRTASETFDRILAGERGFRAITLFDPGDVRSRLVGEIADLTLPSGETVSRTSELALIAAREAIADASLDVRTRRVGLVLGGTTAGMFETESLLATLLSTEDASASTEDRERALSRMLSHPLSAPTDRLAAELGPFVRVRSLSSACSSGANALVVGATWLELGLVDAVVCGAADSLCRVTVSGFNALAALDPNGARPFDVRRHGLTLGEGAAMIVLERAEEMRAGSPIQKRARCTFLGWASRSEAHHITNPEATGEAPFRAMEAALGRAGLSSSDIDYVNAHGTGTPLNDSMETRALGRIFGADLPRVPVSSQKGMIGHTLAAAGAIEAVITTLAIERGILPPTGGLEQPDPECNLRHVLTAEPHPIRAAISSSFGFGGMDTALVFGRFDEAAGAADTARASTKQSPRTPPKRRVVITGIGVVTPAGIFAGEAAADLESSRSSAAVITLPSDALDAEKARRLDRASRIAAVACKSALAASATKSTTTSAPTGLVLGIAFGAVDTTAEFMRRLREKGPRMVRPAEFPSLVPSSPAGHVSIYLGLTGPAFVVADLAGSGECAVTQAYELIASGDVDRVCAGAVEERSVIVEDVLSVVFDSSSVSTHAARGSRPSSRPSRPSRPPHPRGARGEGGVALVLEAEGESSGASVLEGARALARLEDVQAWTYDDDNHDQERGSEATNPLRLSASPPPPNAIVVLGGMSARAEEIVARSSWRDCPRVVLSAEACGTHEAVGGMAIAVAAAKVARGDAPAALYVGTTRRSGYAGTVWPPDPKA